MTRMIARKYSRTSFRYQNVTLLLMVNTDTCGQMVVNVRARMDGEELIAMVCSPLCQVFSPSQSSVQFAKLTYRA